MAKKVSAKVPFFARPGIPAAAQRDNLLEGVLAGLVNSELTPADYRNSQGPIPARGFVTMSAQRKNPQGTVTGYESRITINREAVVDDPDWNLVPGATYYLHTGGGITATPPAGAADLRQVIGYAETSKVLIGCVDAPIINA